MPARNVSSRACSTRSAWPRQVEVAQHQDRRHAAAPSGSRCPCPAMSGALPCTASKTPPRAPMLAPGTTPSPPTRPAPRSRHDVAVEVLEQRARRRSRASSPAACRRRRRCARRRRCPGSPAATRRKQSRNRPSESFMMFALWTAVTRLRPCCARVLEGEPRDAGRGALGDDLERLDDAGHDHVLEAA